MEQLKTIWQILKEFLKQRFNLADDKANDDEVIQTIRRSIEFKGTNLWILIFAIMVASIGLNVNSTAVIIGAMLISPLMGPIMGIGLGVGIYDFSMIKHAFKNFAIATVIGILTSTAYFFITPLSEARSELLARTLPTIWDVFIAFFGGLAGIVAGSRRDKSITVIPGVAIATALMPPLCTAGYGLATLNASFFFGALYLYFINSVFISLATLLIVRFLKYNPVEFLNEAVERKVKRSIYAIVIITLLPSIYLGYDIVMRSVFERNAEIFIQNELSFANTQVINKTIDFKGKGKIEVFLVGAEIDENTIAYAKDQLERHHLKGVELKIRQGYSGKGKEASDAQGELMTELVRKSETQLSEKEQIIADLQKEIKSLRAVTLPVGDLKNELEAYFGSAEIFSIAMAPELRNKEATDTIVMVRARFTKRLSPDERNRLVQWLRVRTKNDQIYLTTE